MSAGLGKAGFLITLICEFGKGGLAVWLRVFYQDERIVAFAMVAVVEVTSARAIAFSRRKRNGQTSLGALLVFDQKLALIIARCSWDFRLQWRTVLRDLCADMPAPLLCSSARTNPVVYYHHERLVLFAHRKNIADESPTSSNPRYHAESDKSFEHTATAYL